MSADRKLALSLGAICARCKLRSALARLALFSSECKKREYTDTGEAWEVMNGVEREIKAALKHLA